MQPDMMGHELHTGSKWSGRQLLRGFIEFLCSIPFAIILLFGLFRFGCASVHGCQDFKGLGIFVFAFVVSSTIWAVFLTLYGRFRGRPKARNVLLAIGALIAVVVWLGPWALGLLGY